jgi:hypothetical protein
MSGDTRNQTDVKRQPLDDYRRPSSRPPAAWRAEPPDYRPPIRVPESLSNAWPDRRYRSSQQGALIAHSGEHDPAIRIHICIPERSSCKCLFPRWGCSFNSPMFRGRAIQRNWRPGFISVCHTDPGLSPCGSSQGLLSHGTGSSKRISRDAPPGSLK